MSGGAAVAAVIAGMLAGFVTGLLHTACGIPAILAGILTQLALYSVNLHIMGWGTDNGSKANLPISVDKYNLLVSSALCPGRSRWTIPSSCWPFSVIIIICVLYWFFGTELGCSLRATGANANMARAQGINTNCHQGAGPDRSPTAWSPSPAPCWRSIRASADINMGRGAIVIGLAAVIIGEVIFDEIFRNFCTSAVLELRHSARIIYYLVMQARAVAEALTTERPEAAVPPWWWPLFLAVPYLRKQAKLLPQSLKKGGAAQCLTLEHIYKTFNPGTVNEKRALRRAVTLHLDEGDFVTVIGGNGAGKSTMLNAVAGVWPVDCGQHHHRRRGRDRPAGAQAGRKYIGRVFQDPMMGTAATMQIEENLALAARRGKTRTLRWGITKAEREEYHELLKMLGLGLEDRMTAKVGLLSGGQRQALTLLMATLQKPKLLLLDEHTAALDPKTAAKVLELSRTASCNENQLTTLMITHNMKDAIVHGNRLIMMNEGQHHPGYLRARRRSTSPWRICSISLKKSADRSSHRIKPCWGEFPKRRTAHIRGLCAFSASGCTPAGKLGFTSFRHLRITEFYKLSS